MSRKAAARTAPPTTDRLRADIDSGKTGEKVPYPDPAVAPLGSDDEAAGRPPTACERQAEAASRESAPAPSRREPQAVWTYVFLIASIPLAVLALAIVIVLT